MVASETEAVEPTDVAPTPGFDGGTVLAEGIVVPESIRDKPIWVVYTDTDGDNQSCSWRADVEEKDRNKVPCDPTTNPTTSVDWLSWTSLGENQLVTFNEAVSIVNKSREALGTEAGLSGVMLALNAPAAEGLGVIDIDDCVDPVAGDIDQKAVDLMDDLDTLMWELSPSGTGVHGYVWDPEGLDENYLQDDVIELYTDRCITFTGRHICHTSESIPEIAGLLSVYQRRFNHKKAGASKSGDDNGSDSVESSMGAMDEYRSPLTNRYIDETDLDKKSRELIEAGCEYDQYFERLYHHGSECHEEVLRELGDTKNSPYDRDGEFKLDDSKSAADASLLSKISFWAFESEMFDDVEFDLRDAERIFLTSDLAQRPKCRDRDDYVRYTLEKVTG